MSAGHRAPLLQVRELVVEFATPRGRVRAVDGVALDVHADECVAVVGESGSGKSQTLLACLGLLAGNGRAHGSATFDGVPLLGVDEGTLNRVRGVGIGTVFQDPMNSLTPHLRIETQLVEVLRDRGLADRESARGRALELLRDVEIPQPEARLRQYPHELSGGMRQRVALAMALVARPRMLFADEPTTALDVSVQARVLELLARVRARHGLAMLLVTHDLGVVAGLADRVAVMYAGRIVEQAPVDRLFRHPAHPYTAALLAAVPRVSIAPGAAHPRLASIPGQPPRPGTIVEAGCAFAARCDRAVGRCTLERPRLTPILEDANRSREFGYGNANTGLAPSAGVVACHRPLLATVPGEVVAS